VNKDHFFNNQLQLSRYNYEAETIEALKLPSKLTVCDVTTRDGAQGSIIGFTSEEKVEIVKKLVGAGVQHIQLGGYLDDVREMCAKLKAEGVEFVGEMLWESTYMTDKELMEKEFDESFAGLDLVTHVQMVPMLSPYAEAFYEGLTTDQVIESFCAQVSYAASKGYRVTVGLVDTTRTDFGVIQRAYRRLVDAGATRIVVFDTMGVCSPAGWRRLISYLRNEFPDVELGAHCHNDYGQAMANVYAAIEVGANFVEASVNGLGERAGNPALAEVAAGAEHLYGVKTGVKLEKLQSLSAFVSDLARQEPSVNKPIVGKWAFVHGDEWHVWGNKAYPWVFEAVKGEVFGNPGRILIGANSFTNSMKYKLEELGYVDIDESKINRILDIVKEESKIRKVVLDDDEIREIVRSCNVG
jgi:isopropylmalate/homocitrate/citramalate synthase